MMHSLSTRLRFGKYQGLTVAAVARFDARYLAWAASNLNGFDLDQEARDVVGTAARKERQFALNQQNAWAWGFGADAKRSRESRVAKLIRIEFEERRRAGQESFTDACGRVQWRSAQCGRSPKGRDAKQGSVHEHTVGDSRCAQNQDGASHD